MHLSHALTLCILCLIALSVPHFPLIPVQMVDHPAPPDDTITEEAQPTTTETPTQSGVATETSASPEAMKVERPIAVDVLETPAPSEGPISMRYVPSRQRTCLNWVDSSPQIHLTGHT